MKKWKSQIKIGKEIYDVIEHTDKECEKPRNDGKFLAPIDHGFVCLYQNGIYEMWCGSEYAKKRRVI